MSDDYVLYDGQCPACSRYVAATGLAGRPDITLIDARHAPALVAEHAAAGRYIDDGMVVAVDGVMLFGADASLPRLDSRPPPGDGFCCGSWGARRGQARSIRRSRPDGGGCCGGSGGR